MSSGSSRGFDRFDDADDDDDHDNPGSDLVATALVPSSFSSFSSLSVSISVMLFFRSALPKARETARVPSSRPLSTAPPLARMRADSSGADGLWSVDSATPVKERVPSECPQENPTIGQQAAHG